MPVMRFDDFLITADFDHTLTGPDGTIPKRNLEAIRYFTDNGGAFTVNTGRSGVTSRALMEQVPANAPFLLMNGSGMVQNGECLELHRINLEPWEVLSRLSAEFPEIELEVQDLDCHYLLNPSPARLSHHHAQNWNCKSVKPGDYVGPFVKFNVFPAGQTLKDALANLHRQDEGVLLFDRVQAFIEAQWGTELVVFRSGTHLLNVHAKGCSKIKAARALQQRLGKKYLVCIGDAGNDISMLDGADFAYCPADGAVANRYENVCESGLGAVADVIYKKIPGILGIQP